MKKYEKGAIIFALSMCLFVGIGSANYKKESVMKISADSIPEASVIEPVFDFCGLNSSSTIKPGDTIYIEAHHTNDYEVTAASVALFQNGTLVAESKTSSERLRPTEYGNGSVGYVSSVVVPSTVQSGVLTKIVAYCEAKSRLGGELAPGDVGLARQIFDSSLYVNTINQAPPSPGTNPYDNVKVMINGSEDISRVFSINEDFTVSASADFTISQIFVTIQDSNGGDIIGESDYADHLTLRNYAGYFSGRTLTNDKIVVVLVDNKGDRLTLTNNIDFKDDRVVTTSKGTFKLDEGKSARALKEDDTIKAEYTAGTNESITSIKLQLVDDNGRVIASNLNTSSGASKLDVILSVDTSTVYKNAKLVCTASASGNEWKEEKTGYSVNTDLEDGTISISKISSGSKFKASDTLRFGFTSDGNATISKMTFEAWKDGKKYKSDSKTLSGTSFEYAYALGSKDIGDITIKLTLQGKSNGKTLDVISKEYTFTVEDETQGQTPQVTSNPDVITTQVKVSLTPEPTTIKKGSQIYFTVEGISANVARIEGVLKNTAGQSFARSSMSAGQNGTKTLTGHVTVNFNGCKESRKIILEITSTDATGGTAFNSYEYIVSDAADNVCDISELPDKQSYDPNFRLDYNFSGVANNVTIELVDAMKNKVLNTYSSLSGTVQFPGEEGTYILRVNKDGVTKEKTCYIVFNNFVVDQKAIKGEMIDLWNLGDDNCYKLNEKIPEKIYIYNNSGSTLNEVKVKFVLPTGFKVDSITGGYLLNGNWIGVGSVPNGVLVEIGVDLMATTAKPGTSYTVNAELYVSGVKKEYSDVYLYIYNPGETTKGKGYINGYPDGTAKPDEPITRAEVAKIFTTAFNLKNFGSDKTFSDVKKTQWHYQYVNKCAQNAIVGGYGDGTFKPNDNIALNELCAMTTRAMFLRDTAMIIVKPIYETDSTWDKQYVTNLERLNMLQSVTTKEAGRKATRGDVVHLVNEALFYYPDSSVTNYFKDTSKTDMYNKDLTVAAKTGTMTRTNAGKLK